MLKLTADESADFVVPASVVVTTVVELELSLDGVVLVWIVLVVFVSEPVEVGAVVESMESSITSVSSPKVDFKSSLTAAKNNQWVSRWKILIIDSSGVSIPD